jgi:hypothetical protein
MLRNPTTIPPLPFVRGEGRGEGSAFAVEVHAEQAFFGVWSLELPWSLEFEVWSFR